MQSNDFYSAPAGIDIASVEYGDDSFLGAIGADANEYVSGKDVAANGYKIADS